MATPTALPTRATKRAEVTSRILQYFRENNGKHLIAAYTPYHSTRLFLADTTYPDTLPHRLQIAYDPPNGDEIWAFLIPKKDKITIRWQARNIWNRYTPFIHPDPVRYAALTLAKTVAYPFDWNNFRNKDASAAADIARFRAMIVYSFFLEGHLDEVKCTPGTCFYQTLFGGLQTVVGRKDKRLIPDAEAKTREVVVEAEGSRPRKVVVEKGAFVCGCLPHAFLEEDD